MTFIQSALAQRIAAKKNKKQNGFTMIELMVVVAIIGVLSAVGLPALTSAQDRAKSSAAKQEAVNTAKTCTIALIGGDATEIAGANVEQSHLVMSPLLVQLTALNLSPSLAVETLDLDHDASGVGGNPVKS